MICPIIAAGIYSKPDNYRDDNITEEADQCKQEDCAWWWSSECAIPALAKQIYFLEGALRGKEI